MKSRILLLSLAALSLAGTAAAAQDATVIGKDTVLPGTGPGTATDGTGVGRLMEAASAEDAAKRQGLKPVAFLTTKMIGVTVRNAAGDSVGKIDDLLITDGGMLRAVVIDVGGFLGLGSKLIAVEPGALVLRPGGDRFSAVLNMSKDTVAAAKPFDPAKVIPAPR
ncbi:PRC-barrel domain-containing protein [Methylobacterium sp. UNC378MF]|uniref:PRC-barrel domain-containing protein n=1 Tax=unclassified Methylobacterium TaxID=2615210 RepID=UPI00088512B5|nr:MULTISPECIES: PRC-barrel domain-containing protein [unclassified Methylobacterium]KAA0124159.1 PRC-barrel domain containing protein [Methylobacterium sp. P1-11]SDA30507.1 PRC-barrel domain-containing protein [Methylobacterium sp. UNC378MF]